MTADRDVVRTYRVLKLYANHAKSIEQSLNTYIGIQVNMSAVNLIEDKSF